MNDWGFFIDMDDIESDIPSIVVVKPRPEYKYLKIIQTNENKNPINYITYNLNKLYSPNIILIIYSKNLTQIFHIIICFILFFLVKQFM